MKPIHLDYWIFFLFVGGIIVIALTGCAPPPIAELLKNGVNCKAQIKMPDRPGETVLVDVKIYDCRERAL